MGDLPETGEDMGFPDRGTLNTLFTILLFAVACAVLYAARLVLVIFAFTILFAYLIDPVVRFLQRHSLFFKDLRRPAVVEVYLIFLLLAAFAGHAFSPRLISINSKVFETLPVIMEDVSTGDIAAKIGEKYGWSGAQERESRQFLLRHREDIDRLARGMEQLTSNAVLVLIVVPVLAIFFLRDGEHMANAFMQLLVPSKKHRAVRAITYELNEMLRRYIRAKVTLGGWSLAFYSAAMFLLRFPHAIALGILGGVLEFIPVAGWMTAAVTILATGILTHSHWMWMALLLGVWRIVMDYFVSPRVVGRNLEIHPLMVIFGMMVGGETGGIVGIYLSIPFMVVIRVIWRRLLHKTETEGEMESETELRSPDSVGGSLLSSSHQ
jgi:predicted PurR-regulated permease PerM